MATRAHHAPFNIVALGSALSAAPVVLFVICLLVALLFPDLPATHAWVGLFSAAPLKSTRVWIDGIAFSVLFGWVTAIILGAVYNWMIAR